MQEEVQGQHTQQENGEERPRGSKEVAHGGARLGLPGSTVTVERPHCRHRQAVSCPTVCWGGSRH